MNPRYPAMATSGIFYTRHSAFSHLATYDDSISVYAKMLESSAYLQPYKELSLLQSPALRRTSYKVDFYISS